MMGTVNKLISRWTDKAGILKRKKDKATQGEASISHNLFEHAEGQEYLNAERENRRFNEMLGISAVQDEHQQNQSTESNLNDTNMKNSKSNSQERLSSERGSGSSEKKRGTGHWRGRSRNYRSINRNYEQGFHDGYAAAMAELQGGVHHRHASDGEFRFNERSNSQIKRRESRSSGSSTLSSRQSEQRSKKKDRNMDYSFPAERKRNQKVKVDLGHAEANVESHKTGRFFIDAHTGGSQPYNPKLRKRGNNRETYNSRLTKTGWKRSH